MAIVDKNNSGEIDFTGKLQFATHINFEEFVMATINREKMLSKSKL